jgi:hypothetical protein
MIYRWAILVLMLWGLNQVLKSWGLGLIGGLLTASVLIGVSISAIVKTRAGLKEILAIRPARWLRFLSVAVLLAALLTAAVRLPIRHSVAAVGCAKPIVLEPIFVTRGGFLSAALPTNSQVTPGDRIATLRSPDDENRIALAAAGLAELETEFVGLLSRVNDEPGLASSINVLREAIDDKRRQLDSMRGEAELFAIVSRAAGTLIEPPWNGVQHDQELGLRGWEGNPLDLQNLGAWIEQGTLLGWVADLSAWNVECFVGESDVLQIRVGAAARLRFDQRPNNELTGRVMKIDPQPLTEVPRTIRGDSRFPTRIRGDRAVVPEETTYRVTIELQTAPADFPTQPASHESLASVRIESTPKSFFERSIRYIRQTFRLEST